MKIEDLLGKCDDAYWERDFKRLIELCDEVLEMDPACQKAISYKSIAYCFLNQPEKTLDILEKGIELYPDNYYMYNNLAMACYDLGDYEKSLMYCEQGLRVKDFDWLAENKIKALLKLDRVGEAIEYYENTKAYIEIYCLLIGAEKYGEAFEYAMDEDLQGLELIVDEIKKVNTSQIGQYYLSWIYKIKFKHDVKVCPVCEGRLIPIVWGYPDQSLIEMAERGEVFLAGCCMPVNYVNYHCTNCNEEFDLGCEGLHIECDDFRLNGYIESKIKQLTYWLRMDSPMPVHVLKKELGGLRDEEFDAFIKHLEDLNYICHPREGYIGLVGFGDL